MKITIDFNQPMADGSVIDPKGISFDRFMENPVITFNFDTARPIGIAENITLENGCLRADLKFDHHISTKEYESYINFLASAGIINGNPAGYIKTDESCKVITEFKLTSVSI